MPPRTVAFVATAAPWR